MNGTCINPQLVLELKQDGCKTLWRCRWDGDGGDAAVADEDRCLSLPDLHRTKMDLPVDEFPLRSLPEVRFPRLLVSLYVVSPIQFHGAKLFETAASMAAIRAQLYGRTKKVRPYSWSLNMQ